MWPCTESGRDSQPVCQLASEPLLYMYELREVLSTMGGGCVGSNAWLEIRIVSVLSE